MKQLRETFLSKMVLITSSLYIAVIKRNKPKWIIQQSDLQYYPTTSLGHHLYLFLEKNRIDLIPKHENHDLFHLLTGYDVSTKDEMKMQFFLLGNGKKSIYLMVSVFTATFLFPELIHQFTQAFNRGQKAHKFYNWNFEAMLAQSFESLQTKIFFDNENVSSSPWNHFSKIYSHELF